ncbi:MAG: substrate-binding domain-containing protein [Faecalibacterium prausnitzii]
MQPAQQVRGSLRIALADSVCSTFLPGLLQRYHARCPQVELVLHTASSDEMLQLLSTNQVDLVYTLDQPLCSLHWCWRQMCQSRCASLRRLQHPLAQESVLPLDILPRQEFLLTERGMSYRDALDQCMAAHGLAIHPYLELGSAALLCQMVEQGMGLSFLPEYIVRSALAEGRLARLNVPDCTVMMHRQLFYHRDKWVTPQMNVFIELVRQGAQTK